ncbi:hypothetical protein PYCCODRAFT_1431542 [Trametes coccinea BRFM310]|uniref:Uncharacterized protein n=1 Tax=Trametes coccinea (strain BRFM310) TaxID=1353009 RepID=A0A1Y2J151_TRAC3|nr:hypothetical protein PYCCODRAFT_1431542 [Trametes coccinea BRFM310]
MCILSLGGRISQRVYNRRHTQEASSTSSYLGIPLHTILPTARVMPAATVYQGDPAIVATVDGAELLGVGDDCSSETMSSDAEDVPAVHPAALTRSLALDRTPASALPMTFRAISQKRAAHSTLDNLCEEEPAKRLKIVSHVDAESNEEEENENEHVDVDGEVVSETREEDAEDEEDDEEEVGDEEDEEVNEAAERTLEAFAHQIIVQSLWDLTGNILDLPKNCGQAGVREMYLRCIQAGLSLSEARVRAGNLSTAAMNARIARGIPISADEARKYARTIHLSVFQPMALGELEGMLAECKSVADRVAAETSRQA